MHLIRLHKVVHKFRVTVACKGNQIFVFRRQSGPTHHLKGSPFTFGLHLLWSAAPDIPTDVGRGAQLGFFDLIGQPLGPRHGSVGVDAAVEIDRIVDFCSRLLDNLFEPVWIHRKILLLLHLLPIPGTWRFRHQRQHIVSEHCHGIAHLVALLHHHRLDLAFLVAGGIVLAPTTLEHIRHCFHRAVTFFDIH